MSRATISLIRAQAQNGTTASAWSRGEGRLGRPAGSGPGRVCRARATDGGDLDVNSARPCVGRARTRSWGMGSTTTICSYEQACSRHRSEVPDGYNIAAHAFAYSCIAGRVWVLNDSQEL
jgi:hypothetical protein